MTESAQSPTVDDLAMQIEELLGLPEESVATDGQTRISLTISQAVALLNRARHGT